MLIDHGHPSDLKNVDMLKFCATYYHVTRRGVIDQHHTIGDRVRVVAELSDSGAIDTYLDIKGRALIIYVLEFSVEGIFNHIVLFFRRGVSTKPDVV